MTPRRTGIGGLLQPQLLTRLSGLHLIALQLVEGVLTGLHRSPHHGSSVEFAEHKEYSPGDDVRHIDWKVFGKSDKYYVKQFEEETNLRGLLLLDVSASMGYASGAESKLDRARLLAAATAYLLLRQQDSAGLLAFGSGLETYVPPRAHSDHLNELVTVLEGVEAGGTTDLGRALTYLAEVAGRRSMVFLFSDLFDFSPRVLPLLRQLRSRRHEVVVFHILDPWELTFPFEDVTLFEGMEGEATVLADPRGIRRQYLSELRHFLTDVRQACVASDVEYIRVDTGRPPEEALLALLGGTAARRSRWRRNR